MSTQYTATVSGATDSFEHSMASPVTWTFTTAATPTYTLFSNGSAPVIASGSDSQSDELGVKFEALTNGYVSGIRFYKGAANTGTHVGYLWDANGNLLASATFTNETATGWQQVTFASPVFITANAVYTASYLAPNGGYAADGGYFATAGVTSGPLYALSNAEVNGQGVFSYTDAFPTTSFNATNYWVDVIFNSTPPAVGATAPNRRHGRCAGIGRDCNLQRGRAAGQHLVRPQRRLR